MSHLEEFAKLPAETKQVIDLVFKTQKLPPFSEMLTEYKEALDTSERLESLASAPKISIETEVKASGEIPAGKLTSKKAEDVFPCLKGFGDFEIPFWEWEDAHPFVPKIKEGYIFRSELLLPVLWGLISNERTWLTGHTGSGKTTLVEQVAAHIYYPFICINFDSEISRYDLVGKMDLVATGGTTETKWVDGILPQAMSSPFIACYDEIDFIRPDIAYVMQRVFEGNSLRILEDGGREVKPHPMYRAFATGNTNGQGDEHGIYQGARPQSAAFLNRFTTWVNVPYMDKSQIEELIRNDVPAFKDHESLARYVSEHQEMFSNGDVVQPISPRTFTSIARKAIFYKAQKHPTPNTKAFEDTVLSACSADDSRALIGLWDRTFK